MSRKFSRHGCFGGIGNTGVTRNGITMTSATEIRYHLFQ